jgi:hypothetical protein
MLKAEVLAGSLKVPVELGPIVSLNILDSAVKQDIQAVEKIPGRSRTMRGAHSGKGNLGMPVDSGENIALLAMQRRSGRDV